MQREEDQLSEMGDGARIERESIPNEGKWPKKGDSVIRPKRRGASGSLGRNGFGRKYSFCKRAET